MNKEVTKISVWAAKDGNGKMYLYANEPYRNIGLGMWICSGIANRVITVRVIIQPEDKFSWYGEVKDMSWRDEPKNITMNKSDYLELKRRYISIQGKELEED